ncbi:MAG TPA: HAMP domain-containing sensor histidine kinase, partial [Humisphaera sp.]
SGVTYLIRSEHDRRTLPPTAVPTEAPPDRPPVAGYTPTLLSAAFGSTEDGRPARTVTFRAVARTTPEDGNPVPVVVAYTAPVEPFRRTLDRLFWTLVACGAAAGLLAAGVAWRISRAALSPLHEVARVVGSVSEQRLDRRIDVDKLPPELRLTARRLNRMLARLQDSFARRRRFLADASHELRTPVAAILTRLEVTLGRDRSAEAYKAAVQSAAADATRLRALVERLMEQVRGEQFADAEPVLEPVDLHALATEVAATVAPLAASRAVTVRVDGPTPWTMESDPGRVRTILANLVSNAVEYNRPGGTVTVSVVPAADDDGGAEVVVRDTGIGIPPDQLGRVFDPFFRGDAARTGNTVDPAAAGHLGLGLFLVRTHVAALGGGCRVQSVPGEGTEFRVRLPNLAATGPPGGKGTRDSPRARAAV